MSWAVICDARKGRHLGITTLAMVDRRKNQQYWWTSDDVKLVMRFTDFSKAKTVCDRLKRNSPRIVDYEAAIAIIQRQKDGIEIDDHGEI